MQLETSNPKRNSSVARPRIAKTIKLFIGGKFPRSESGRSFPVALYGGEEFYAHLCLASRKDFREAVEAAAAGLQDWSNRTAYNRGQILYRMAEMCEGKRVECVALFKQTLGWTDDRANVAVDEAIDAFVYYAGFCDKYAQLVSTMNPVNGPFGNVTAPEPVGNVALVAETKFDFGRLAAQISSVLAGGNSVTVLLDKNGECPAVIAPLSEVLATSDLPGGAVNLLTGDPEELLEVMGSHMDIRSFSMQNEKAEYLERVKARAVENLKRVVPPRKECRSLEAILDTVEFKTIWQPVGF